MANYDVESHRHGTEKCFYFLFWHPTHARTTRYEEAFLPEGKKRPRSRRSLGLDSLLLIINTLTKHVNVKTTAIVTTTTERTTTTNKICSYVRHTYATKDTYAFIYLFSSMLQVNLYLYVRTSIFAIAT